MNTIKFKTMTPSTQKNRPVLGRFPSFFDEFFNDFQSASLPHTRVPAVNVKESDNSYELEIAAPGMQKDEFNVEVDNDMLIISGEVKQESQSEDEKYTRKEFSFQSFKRSFSLPENSINIESIEAKYTDGILRITLPKLREQAHKNNRRIVIG